MNAASALAYVRELERRDAAVANDLDSVEQLLGRTRELAERAGRTRRFLQRLPRECEAAAAAVERAAADVSAHRRQLQTARAAARDASRRNVAEHEADAERIRCALERAEEDLASAVRRAADLDLRAVETEEEAKALDATGAELARELRAAPRLAARWPGVPEAGLDDLLAWAARTEGALLLARGALNGDREAIVREANELAANVIGGTTAPAGVARIRERVEQELGREGVDATPERAGRATGRLDRERSSADPS